MAYLDETGLARFWYDIKQWIASALSNLVHRTGHEDITGRKVFNISQYYDAESSHNILVSRPILRTLDFSRGDAAPSEDKYVSLDMVDSTYDVDTPYLGTARLGGLDYIFRTSGERTLGFTLLNPQNANIKLLLGYDASGVAFASAPSTSSQRNSGTDIVTRDWIPNDIRVVHTTGDETINGLKTFNQYVTVNRVNTSFAAINPELTFGQNPSEDKTNILRFIASNNHDYGGLQSIYRQNGETLTRISVEKSDGGDGSVLEVNIPATGAPYAWCPSTPDPTPANLNGRTYNKSGGTDILTRDWIPRDTRIVHTSGNENITGVKYFNGSVYIKHPNLVKGTNPSSTVYRQLNFIEDADNSTTPSRIGCVENFVATDGSTETTIRAYNYVANSTTYERIAIIYPKNGTPYTYAPTPSDANDNSTKIATTAWAFPRYLHYYTSTAASSLNLDNFTTPGQYFFQGTSGTAASNLPDGVNGTLFVFTTTNPYTTIQMFFRSGTQDVSDHRVFFRQRHGVNLGTPSWSQWYRLFTDKDTIPVANGGTGQTSVANIQAGKDGNGNTISSTYLKLSGGTMTGHITRNGELCKSGNAAGSISVYNGSSASDGAGIWLYGKSHSTRPGWLNLQTSDGTDYYSFIIEPSYKYARFNNKITSVISDISATLGSTSRRWGVLYTTGNVNVGSDERIKQQIGAIPDAVLDAWESVDWCQFKLNAEVESGGEGADLHTGLIAQRAGKALSSAGIDPLKYGFIAHAEWDAVPEELDEEGNVVVPARPAGDEYSICYVEALCIEAAYQRRRADRAEARIAALEDRLAALELRLGSE